MSPHEFLDGRGLGASDLLDKIVSSRKEAVVEDSRFQAKSIDRTMNRIGLAGMRRWIFNDADDRIGLGRRP
jgi:hypothetical protein